MTEIATYADYLPAVKRIGEHMNAGSGAPIKLSSDGLLALNHLLDAVMRDEQRYVRDLDVPPIIMVPW
jgi:hypothetical protein